MYEIAMCAYVVAVAVIAVAALLAPRTADPFTRAVIVVCLGILVGVAISNDWDRSRPSDGRAPICGSGCH